MLGDVECKFIYKACLILSTTKGSSQSPLNTQRTEPMTVTSLMDKHDNNKGIMEIRKVLGMVEDYHALQNHVS